MRWKWVVAGVAGLGLAVAGVGAWRVEVMFFELPATALEPLPEALVALDSPQGQQWLSTALRGDHEALVAAFQPQARRGWCGVASATIALDALDGTPDPQGALFTPEASAVRSSLQATFAGMTLDELGGILEAHGEPVAVTHAGDADVDAFRAALRTHLTQPGDVVVVNYWRQPLGQGEMGHISPISAWDPGSDRALVLDTAAHRFPPTWVPVVDLFAAMNTVDPTAQRTRGWLVVGQAAPIRVALTFDDLPYQTLPSGPTVSDPGAQREVSEAMLAALGDTPAVVFANCDWGDDALLALWREAGVEIGNHTASHVHIDRVARQVWEADVRRCHERLGSPRWFRFPYLNRGADRARRDAGAAFLAELGERAVPVTEPTTEWLLSQRYDAEPRFRDRVVAAWLEHMVDGVRQARRMAIEVRGRDVAHIALLHVNQLEADHLGELLARFRAEGFALISLDEALADPIYAEPDAWERAGARSWQERVSNTTAPSWFQDQEAELEQRFPEGLAPRPFTAGEIRDGFVQGLKLTWRITDPGGAQEQVWTVQASNPQGMLLADGRSPEAVRSTWEELMHHADFPADRTTLTHAVVEVPAGRFEANLYEVQREDGVARFWFAPERPGPPVRHTVEQGGKQVFEMALVAADTPG